MTQRVEGASGQIWDDLICPDYRSAVECERMLREGRHAAVALGPHGRSREQAARSPDATV